MKVAGQVPTSASRGGGEYFKAVINHDAGAQCACAVVDGQWASQLMTIVVLASTFGRVGRVCS